MITHDQIERSKPTADLVRFKSLGETLSRRSAEVVFITLNDKAKYEVAYYKNSKVYKIPVLSRIRLIHLVCFCVLLLPTMFRAKRAGCFDILFVNSLLSVPSVLIFRWFSGYGVIQFDLMGILSEERFHGRRKSFWVNTAKKILSSAEDFLLSRIDFVTTINEKHRQILTNRIPRPVFVIRDAVHEEVLEQTSGRPGDQLKTSKIVVIFVGQVSDGRLDPLLKIMPEVLAEFPNLELQVLGSGPDMDRSIDMVESFGISDKVIFRGHMPHEKIFSYIKMADIAYSDVRSVHGFPMKIFEYLAMGKPVIAECTEGVQELLIDHANALLYQNERELREKILALAQDARLRKEMGENARQAMAEHTWEKRVEELSAIYGQFLNFRRDF